VTIKLEDFSKHTLRQWSTGHQKNQSYAWIGSDTESLFKRNLKHKKRLMKKVPKDVVYRTNEYGFRCDSFDKKSVILFNGCSHTFGIGINVEDTYASLLARSQNVPYHNISLGSSDISLAVSRSIYWLLKLKPKVHFFQCPSSARVGHYISRKRRKEINFISSAQPDREWPSHKLDLMLEENMEWNYYSSICTLKQICQELNIHLICKTWTNMMQPYPQGILREPIPLEEEIDTARDLIHAGVETNLCLFKGLLKEGLF
tara:strand:+ start:5491 stop:6267 length:777 start_codon:yes stop_codon:yes gene_type:complete